MKDGEEFLPQNYPLHITIIPSFMLASMSAGVIDRLTEFCLGRSMITTKAGPAAYFGPNNEVGVTTVVMNDELQSLHAGLTAILENAGAIFDEPEYMGDNYRAHATHQQHERLHEGDAVTIDNLTIIDKFPDGDPNKRKLLKTIELSK